MKRILIIVGIGVCLTACKTKEKQVKNTLVEREFSGSIDYQRQKQTLNVDYFGDKLSGNMSVADSTEADSSTFESNGIKLKIKVTRNKKGSKDIGFVAEAKPVARSSLTSETENLKAKEKQSFSEKIHEETKIKKSVFGGFGWWLAIIGIAVAVYLFRRFIKF